MTLTDTIGSPYYQLSTVGVGAIAVGAEDIRQCIDIILRTIPGSDPLRPLFGCDAYKYNDDPSDIAIPNIKKEIFESLSIWEPRIQVRSINHRVQSDSQLDFEIVYNIVDDDLLDTVSFSAAGTTTTATSGGIILTAIIPVHVTNGIYRVSFMVDSKAVFPSIPSTGFKTASDMLEWINANWFAFGRWYLTAGSLVLYMNGGIAQTASLNVSQTAELTLEVLIPKLEEEGVYNLVLTADGVTALPVFETGINTIEGLLNWLRNNYGAYGNWSVRNVNIPASEGDYSNDYSDDYENSDPFVTDSYLIFQSGIYTSAEVVFSIE